MIVELIDAGLHANGHILATVDVTDDEGNTTRLAYFFPPDTMEWRVAEYDLDPVADADLLLDIVLFEPHIELPEEKRLYMTDRATAKATLLDTVKAERGKSEAAKANRREGQAEADKESEVRRKVKALSVWHPTIVEDKKKLVQRKHDELATMPEPTDRVTAAMRKRQFEELSSHHKVQAAERGRNNGN